MRAKQLSCLYRHPTAAAAVSFTALAAFAFALTTTNPSSHHHISCPTALSTFRPPLWYRLGSTPLARPSASKPTRGFSTHPLTHLHSSITTTAIGPIGALSRLPICRLDPPLLSQVAPTREEERKRDFTFTPVLLCPALHRSTDSEHVPRSGCRSLCWRKSCLSRETSVRKRKTETETDRGQKRRQHFYHATPAWTGAFWTSPPTSSPPCDLTA
jgi:hypothetical protein